jgi:hypothetical protein
MQLHRAPPATCCRCRPARLAAPSTQASTCWPGQIGINYDGNSGGTVSNATIDGNTYGIGTISADPLYLAAPSDLHLRTRSPAIDSGSASNTSVHDHDDNLRPRNGGSGAARYDMGAYEVAGGIFIDGFD